MITLRILGFIVSVGLLFLAVRRYRRRDLRLPDALIMGALALGLFGVSLAPSSVDPLLRELGFPPGDARRVIGVLVVSNILTYLLLMRSFAATDRLARRLGEHSDRVAARWFEHDHGRGDGGSGRVAVVIPAFNEEDSIGDVLPLIPERIDGHDVERIVVSDGSNDGTEDLAREHGALVVGGDLRRGQGAAVALGYRMALLRGARAVATLDADGQYDPLELPQLVRPILAGEADVVHGSRALGAYERPIPGRAQGLKVFARVTSLIARTRITDPASGFRAFAPHALRDLEFRESQFHASEVTIAAAKRGLRIKEVPCTFRDRFAGTTKKPALFRYGWGYTRALLRTWLS